MGSHVSSDLTGEDRARLVGSGVAGAEFAPEIATESSAQVTGQEDGSAQRPDTAAAPVWLQRVSLVMLVLFCVYLGGFIAYLPWWTRIWDQNMFINSHPVLAAILHNGAVRGLISGLGLIDIWIGISEAIHYRDHRS